MENEKKVLEYVRNQQHEVAKTIVKILKENEDYITDGFEWYSNDPEKTLYEIALEIVKTF
jgi:hypothetical protein